MAEPSPPTEPVEPGAPIAPGQIDPDLVKLARSRPKVGLLTAAGLVVLSIAFLIRLGPDRRFAGQDAKPATTTVADVVAGKLDSDALIALTAEPVIGQAIRASKAQGTTGVRIAPARGSGERLWLVLPGDGWTPPSLEGYAGRLRKLDDLPFASVVRDYAIAHPAPAFATAAAIHAGLASGTVTTVDGSPVTPAAGDTIALDVIDPDASTIAASFNDHFPDTAAWTKALQAADIGAATAGTPNVALGQVRFTVPAPVAATTAKLQAANLWAARVEPVTRHHQTTWAALHKSSAGSLDVGDKQLPDGQIELVGLSVARTIPAGAYALVVGELPDDYWYVMPLTVALLAIVIIFAWALVRAVRRDLLARP